MISTQGFEPKKKTRGSSRGTGAAAAAETSNDTSKPKKPRKSRLNKQDLKKYRDLLLERRAELLGDMDAIENEALHSSSGDVTHMPLHMADIGSETYDKDFLLGLAESERQRLREIDEALQRIADGTYGICQMTGKPIPKSRLNVKPWAKYTVEAARIIEQSNR